jgi:hypothetical protein
MARSLQVFVDDFDLDAVGVFEIDGVVPGWITGRCHGTPVQRRDSVGLKEICDELVDHFCGLYVERYVAEPSSFAMELGFLVTWFGDLNAKICSPIGCVEVVPVGKDGELKEVEKVLPKIEGFVLVGNVDPDVTQSRFLDFTVVPTPRCVWCSRW